MTAHDMNFRSMNHKQPASVNPFTLEAVEDLVYDDEVEAGSITFNDIQDEFTVKF